jgi:hypothetical protein
MTLDTQLLRESSLRLADTLYQLNLISDVLKPGEIKAIEKIIERLSDASEPDEE